MSKKNATIDEEDDLEEKFQREDTEFSGTHPALKHFNRTAFIIKNALLKAIKGALIGAAIIGIGGLVGSTLFMQTHLGGGLAIWNTVKGLFSSGSITQGFTGMLGNSGMYGALIGAVGGAVAGLLVGVSEGSELAGQEEDRLIARYEQREARQEQAQALSKRRDQQRMAMREQEEEMGLSPNIRQGRSRRGQEQTV